MSTLLEIEGLSKTFPVVSDGRRHVHRAVNGVDLTLDEGETLGIVGESGCGKSTLARMVLRLTEPTAGRIRFAGVDITHAGEMALRPFRARAQIVFQDPYSALNPRLRVRDIIAEPLHNLGWEKVRIDARVAEVLRVVGLSPSYADRYPHAFSGGQRQRIGIARALATNPKLIVADEAVSALDVSVQAQILNLLLDIQREYGLAMLFISHNLAVIRHVSHRVAVMYLGEIVEMATEADLFARPQHPYTVALMSAVPEPDLADAEEEVVLEGELPSPLDPPGGCVFHTRCPIAQAHCQTSKPALAQVGEGHSVRCHHPGEFVRARTGGLKVRPETAQSTQVPAL